jgi:phosphatidate cytidylyltransferase
MNDSSWGAAGGRRRPPAPQSRPADGGPTGPPGGARHHGRPAPHPYGPVPGTDTVRTGYLPPAPGVPDTTGDADGQDAAARLNGPLFRDEAQAPPGTFAATAGPGGGPAGQDPGDAARHHAPAPAGPGAPAEPPAPRRGRAGRNLKAAIGVGVGLGAVVVASLFVFKAAFLGVVAVAVVVGLWELTARLAERKEIRASPVPLAVGGTAMLVAGYVRDAEAAWVALALTLLAALVWRMTEPAENYLRDVTASVFALFYVPFLATFVVLMLAADDGAWRVLTFLILTVCSDTGAYAVGARFGKRKLAPRISPGKTRAGLVGAIVLSMIAGALCLRFLVDGGAWWQGLVLGFAAAGSATLGDLGESMIKRDLGIKDMGSLLPGHGGVMDRLDSLLPTAPVVWLLLVAFVGSG